LTELQTATAQATCQY